MDYAYHSHGAFSRCDKKCLDDPESLVSQIKRKQDAYYNKIPFELRTLLDKPFQVLFGFFPLKRYARLHVTSGEDGENLFLGGFYPEEISCVIVPKSKLELVNELLFPTDDFLNTYDIKLFTFEECFQIKT